MRRRCIRIPLLLVLTLLATLLAAAPASALEMGPCGSDVIDVTCGRMVVPVDRAGDPGGPTLTLDVERWRWAPTRATPILALASGRAADVAEDLVASLDPFLQGQRRDLVVVDGRAAAAPACSLAGVPSPDLGERCGRRLGSAAAGLGAAQGGEDLAAVVAALRLDRVVLYAGGFAAPAAVAFAAAHPDRVEALVLDAPRGWAPDPLRLDSLHRSAALLDKACRGHCPTRHVEADMRALATRLTAGPLPGEELSARGDRTPATFSETDLARILLDVPLVRMGEVPAAIVAALDGDAATALRLRAAAADAADAVPTATEVVSACGGMAWPWDAALPAAERLSTVLASARPGVPFSATALAAAAPLSQICAGWPSAGVAPPDARPTVRTLVLAGDRDRTVPPEAAARIAALLPAGRLSVLGGREDGALSNAPYACLSSVLGRFLRGTDPPVTCDPRRTGSAEERMVARYELQLPVPDRVPPTALGRVPAAPGLAGTAARALTAVVWTLQDVADQRARSTVAAWAGLRDGFVTTRGRTCTLHSVAYVPGVRLTGRLDACVLGTLRVSGPAGARGTLTIDPRLRLTGRLGGRRVRARLAIDAAGELILRSGARGSPEGHHPADAHPSLRSKS